MKLSKSAKRLLRAQLRKKLAEWLAYHRELHPAAKYALEHYSKGILGNTPGISPTDGFILSVRYGTGKLHEIERGQDRAVYNESTREMYEGISKGVLVIYYEAGKEARELWRAELKKLFRFASLHATECSLHPAKALGMLEAKVQAETGLAGIDLIQSLKPCEKTMRADAGTGAAPKKGSKACDGKLAANESATNMCLGDLKECFLHMKRFYENKGREVMVSAWTVSRELYRSLLQLGALEKITLEDMQILPEVSRLCAEWRPPYLGRGEDPELTQLLGAYCRSLFRDIEKKYLSECSAKEGERPPHYFASGALEVPLSVSRWGVSEVLCACMDGKYEIFLAELLAASSEAVAASGGREHYARRHAFLDDSIKKIKAAIAAAGKAKVEERCLAMPTPAMMYTSSVEDFGSAVALAAISRKTTAEAERAIVKADAQWQAWAQVESEAQKAAASGSSRLSKFDRADPEYLRRVREKRSERRLTIMDPKILEEFRREQGIISPDRRLTKEAKSPEEETSMPAQPRAGKLQQEEKALSGSTFAGNWSPEAYTEHWRKVKAVRSQRRISAICRKGLEEPEGELREKEQEPYKGTLPSPADEVRNGTESTSSPFCCSKKDEDQHGLRCIQPNHIQNTIAKLLMLTSTTTYATSAPADLAAIREESEVKKTEAEKLPAATFPVGERQGLGPCSGFAEPAIPLSEESPGVTANIHEDAKLVLESKFGVIVGAGSVAEGVASVMASWKTDDIDLAPVTFPQIPITGLIGSSTPPQKKEKKGDSPSKKSSKMKRCARVLKSVVKRLFGSYKPEANEEQEDEPIHACTAAEDDSKKAPGEDPEISKNFIRVVEFLREEGAKTERVFRVPGAVFRTREIYDALFNPSSTASDEDIARYLHKEHVYEVADAFKKYIRGYREGMVGKELCVHLYCGHRHGIEPEMMARLLLALLGPRSLFILHQVGELLRDLGSCEAATNISYSSLVLIFAPNFFSQDGPLDVQVTPQLHMKVASCFFEYTKNLQFPQSSLAA